MPGRTLFQWLLAAGLGAAALAAHGQPMIICQAPQGGQVPCPSPFGDAYAEMAEIGRRADERRAREWADDKAGREADYWGALAVLAPSGEAVNLGFESQPKWAFNPLRRACNMRLGCDVAVVYKNTCVALARGDRGQIFLADDPKPQQASTLASQACTQAGGGACKVAKNELTCSGYNYIDSITGEGGIGQKSLFSKWRKLRFDVAARAGGDIVVQPPAATYNPRLRQALARPLAERAKLSNQDVRQDAAWAKLDLVPPPDLWLAFAFSPSAGETGLGLERDESAASSQAQVKCGARDCKTVMTAHSGQCFAITLRLAPENRLEANTAITTSLEEANRAGAQECRGDPEGCQVVLAQCVD